MIELLLGNVGEAMDAIALFFLIVLCVGLVIVWFAGNYLGIYRGKRAHRAAIARIDAHRRKYAASHPSQSASHLGC